MKVLFVCRGNHGRSQLAEALFEKLCEGKCEVISAGTQVVTNEKNREGQKVSDQHIVEVMREMGVDITEKTRNQLTPDMVESADKIVVMAQPETIPEYLKLSKKAVFWEVPDPQGQSLEFARNVRNYLESQIKDFVKTFDEKKIKPWQIL